MTDHERLQRWRLILGRYSDRSLEVQSPLERTYQQIDETLDYLYGREYSERQIIPGSKVHRDHVKAIDWLNRTRKLFPKNVFERLQGQAIERYGMSELLTDPSVIEGLEPSQSLVKTLLSLRGRLNANTRDAVRALITKTVDEITQRLKPQVTNALIGRRNRFRSSNQRTSQNFDWRKTVNANLKNYSRAHQKLIIERPYFYSRIKRQLPWDIVLCVDQSGSMTDSIIYASVLSGILAGLPGVSVKLVVFDTSIVDLTSVAHDPVDVLLTVQLGGGTDIGRAVMYCERLIDNPHRTIFTLVSDFCEGAPPSVLLNSVRRMAESKVTLLGLAALDDDANPIYDKEMGQRLAANGMHVAALTPENFAEWLGEVING